MKINENIMLNDKVTYISKISSQAIYSVLISQKFLEPTAKIKFRDCYGEEMWERACRNIYVTSIDTFTRYFQFKILHNYLAVNTVKIEILET